VALHELVEIKRIKSNQSLKVIFEGTSVSYTYCKNVSNCTKIQKHQNAPNQTKAQKEP